MEKRPVVLVMGDSPSLHTGFAEVIRQSIKAFAMLDWDIHVLGFMNPASPDQEIPVTVSDHVGDKEFQYRLYFSPGMDDLCHGSWDKFVRITKPDVIYIVTDAVNLHHYMYRMKHKVSVFSRKTEGGAMYLPAVISYTPIENAPISKDQGEALRFVQWLGGVPILYCNAAAKIVRDQFPDVTPMIAHHGLDHANFRKYSCDERKALRRMVGLDDYFVIGTGGVNKRTKGLDSTIYAARELRDMDEDEGIIFYIHTNPTQPTMNGYDLEDMAKYYGVRDMILFKQQTSGRGYWQGADRDSDNTVDQVMSLQDQIPDTPEKRGLIWSLYDFVSLLNCFDIGLDLSQIEGWGLWPGEMMACGIPVAQIKDYGVRDEIYKGGRFEIEPLPQRLWTTWHNNARLVNVDPRDVAEAIVQLRYDRDLRDSLSRNGQEVASKYKWSSFAQSLSEIAKKVYEDDQGNIETAIKDGIKTQDLSKFRQMENI